MKFINKNWHKIILIVYAFVSPVISFAQITIDTTPGNTGGRIENPIPSITSIPVLIQTLLEGMLTIGIPVVALAIIYSGFLFVFARGNSEKLGKAKDSLLYTVIGAAILLGAWSLAKMIKVTVLAL
jgi:hypothetical protein